MRLSPLQQFIVRSCHETKGKVSRALFNKFYDNRRTRPHRVVDSITNALLRLIDRGVMTGFGIRTPKKWFIKEVRLTPLGKKIAKRLRGEQQQLPFA